MKREGDLKSLLRKENNGDKEGAALSAADPECVYQCVCVRVRVDSS